MGVVGSGTFNVLRRNQEEIKRRAGPLLEQALLWTKAWDERGRQYGSPKPRYLRRYEKQRWYIADYAQQF